MKKRSILALAVAAATTVGMLTGCASGSTPAPVSTADPALVKAAQAEGELVFYSVPAEKIDQALVDAFKAKYGINAKFVRNTTAALQTKIDTEIAAGALPADMIMISNSAWVSTQITKSTFLNPLAANIPGYPWAFPTSSIAGDGTVGIQVTPSGISYNTDLVKGDSIPKDWTDVAKPEFKGKVLLQDPAASPASIEFWYVIKQKFGIDLLKQIGANVKRMYPSIVPLSEALAAGEGSLALPNTGAGTGPLEAKGAPIKTMYPATTTGPVIVPLINSKATHPNAARLFTQFVMEKDGNAILNSDPGTVSPYNKDAMPAGFVQPDRAAAAASKAEIVAALTGK